MKMCLIAHRGVGIVMFGGEIEEVMMNRPPRRSTEEQLWATKFYLSIVVLLATVLAVSETCL
jgi:hypothetical protein